MRISDPEIFHQRRDGMIAATPLDSARDLLRGMESRDQERYGGSRAEARDRLARRIGVTPGTLYNLAFNRLKRLDETLRARLSAYAVRDLEQEIEGLSHELEVARALGAPQDPKVVRRLEAVIARAHALHADAVGAGK